MTSPINIICYACSLMAYWVRIFGEEEKETPVNGAKAMLQIALQLVNEIQSSRKRALAEDAKDDDHEE